MPLSQQLANLVYDGSYTAVSDSVQEINVGIEVNAVRPVIIQFGYVNFVWSASFVLNALNPQPAYYDPEFRRARMSLGWYEIRYGLTPMSIHPIDGLAVGTPKVTGVYDGAVTVRPGNTFVVGNGATLNSINIASDRPYRGDTLRYYLKPGVTGTIYLAVTTGYVDNASGTQKYIIHP